MEESNLRSPKAFSPTHERKAASRTSTANGTAFEEGSGPLQVNRPALGEWPRRRLGPVIRDSLGRNPFLTNHLSKFTLSRHFASPLLSSFHGTAHRNHRMSSGAFDPSFLSREAPYSRGALVPDETRSALSPQESFVRTILNRWVSLSIWGLPKRRHGSSPQNSGKAPLYVF
jgi:hypothetical protein